MKNPLHWLSNVLHRFWHVFRMVFSAAFTQIKFFLILFVGYLLFACVMPYFQIGGIVPNLLFALIAIVTVGFGRLRAVWAGAFFGILTEVMMPTIQFMNIVLYPVCAITGSIPFADKSEAKLERERSLGKSGRNLNPYLRTTLCAALNAFVYELVNIFYIYLRGADVTRDHIATGLNAVVLTALFTLLIALPVRRLYGFQRRRKLDDDAAQKRFRDWKFKS